MTGGDKGLQGVIKHAKQTVTEMTETNTRDENKTSSMANMENCKYKTVGCQVSSKCDGNETS